MGSKAHPSLSVCVFSVFFGIRKRKKEKPSQEKEKKRERKKRGGGEADGNMMIDEK